MVQPGGPSRNVPFLSVGVRVGDRELRTLADTMVCLSGQQDQGFEVILVGHDLGAQQRAALTTVVEGLPLSLAGRVRVQTVSGGAPARAFQVAADAATGCHVAFLTDELLFGHWVSAFADLSRESPGRVLRAVVAEQDFRSEAGYAGDFVVSVSHPTTPYPDSFELFDHLTADRSPLCGLAYPRSCFTEHGLRFDEELGAGASWDLLLRAVLRCGVASSGEATSIRRRWLTGDGDELDPATVQPEVVELILGRLDSTAQVLPPGSVTRLRELARIRESERAPSQAEQILDLQRQLAEVHRSTSWRISAPVRVAGRIARALKVRTR